MKRRLGELRAFLFDMDGTLTLGDQLIEGARELLLFLETRGIHFALVTNNSSKTAKEYCTRLQRLGLPITRDRIVTSVDATISWLRANAPDATVYVVGTPSLMEELACAGIHLVSSQASHADVVLIGFDTTATYEKLETATRLVLRGARLVATNPDFRCPVPGWYIPDCGALTRVIELTTEVQAVYLGKPERAIIDAALNGRGIEYDQAAFVGDRLYTDVAAARRNGLTAILVLSGETRPEDLTGQAVQPDYVFETVRQLHEELLRSG